MIANQISLTTNEIKMMYKSRYCYSTEHARLIDTVFLKQIGRDIKGPNY